MSNKFQKPTSWVYEHFDDTEKILQSGLFLWEQAQRDKNKNKIG